MFVLPVCSCFYNYHCFRLARNSYNCISRIPREREKEKERERERERERDLITYILPTFLLNYRFVHLMIDCHCCLDVEGYRG